MDDVFLIHHPSGSFSCVVAYRVTTLPLQPQLSLTLSVMGANSKTQTTKCHVHYVLYTLKGIGVQSTVTEQWSVLTFKLTLFFFSSVQREEDLKQKKELSLELANVREELGKRRFYTSSLPLCICMWHTHTYTNEAYQGRVNCHSKPGVLHTGHISRLSSAQFVLLL